MSNQSQTKLASIPKRLGAVFIDIIIVGLISLVMGFILNFLIPEPKSYTKEMNESANNALYFVTAIVVDLFYTVILMSSVKSGTYGQQSMEIKVTKLDGSRIDYSTTWIRYFSSYISSIIFKLGYVTALFTPKKQTLHDLFAKTIVVETSSNEIPEFFKSTTKSPYQTPTSTSETYSGKKVTKTCPNCKSSEASLYGTAYRCSNCNLIY